MRAALLRVWHLMRKELIELRQDPRLFGIVIVAPVLQLAVLGYAATTDVTDVPMLVVDADRSTESRALVARFEQSANFVVVEVAGSTTAVAEALDRGRAWMALSIPPGFGASVAAGRAQALQVVADGTDANSTNVALGYARALVAGYAQDLVEARRLEAGAPATAPVVSAAIRVWFNPDLESRDFMIPGIVALLLLVTLLYLAALLTRPRGWATVAEGAAEPQATPDLGPVPVAP
ncbi:MAG: ABC transporter permease [Vicinamibacteria bacterium]